MQSMTDTITDLDLAAYVDGQLDDWQRARVEGWLALRPDAAARVMQDLHLQRELRLALSSEDGDPGAGRMAEAQTAEPRTADWHVADWQGAQRQTVSRHAASRQAAARLSRAFRRDAQWRRARRILPAAALGACLWLAWAGGLPLGVPTVNAAYGPPEFVGAAIAARDASMVRMTMQSVPETPDLDPVELRAMTGILLPQFDPGWTILDAQVFPSPQGPGLEIVFDTPDLGRVMHFAVRPGDFAVTLPQSQLHHSDPVVWFQIGETAHVLIAEQGDLTQLAAAAERLGDKLH